MIEKLAIIGVGLIGSSLSLALREANVYEPQRYRHLISAIRIQGEQNRTYTVKTSYAVNRTMLEGDTTIFSSGVYLDKIVFEEGEPKLKDRTVVFDSRRVHTLMVIPI